MGQALLNRSVPDSEPAVHQVRATDGTLLFRIPRPVLSRLLYDVTEALLRGPQNEIGGVITGRPSGPGEGVATLLDFIPAENQDDEHADRSQSIVENVLMRYPASRESRAIGLYRTHSDPEPAVRADDREALKHIFDERPALLVLIQATGSKPPSLQIYRAVGSEIEPLCGFPLTDQLSAETPELFAPLARRGNPAIPMRVVAVLSSVAVFGLVLGRFFLAETPPAQIAVKTPDPVLSSDAPRPAQISKPVARPSPPALPAAKPARANPASPVRFTGPVPIRKVNPALPPNVLSQLREPVSLRLIVHLDREGRVTHVRSDRENTGVRKLLFHGAEKAVRLWRFHPARRDGQAVASETSVQFRFARR